MTLSTVTVPLHQNTACLITGAGSTPACPAIIEQTSLPEDQPSQTSFRWPVHVAKNMANLIHQQVREMLSQSRLVRKAEGVQLIRREDIVRVGQMLGEGAFSQVKAVTLRDGRRYACKHLNAKLMSQPDNFRLAASELACEAHMLASFDHPCILKIRGWAFNGIASFAEGWHDSFFLLLDQLDETLDHRITRWQMEEDQRHQLAGSALLNDQALVSSQSPWTQLAVATCNSGVALAAAAHSGHVPARYLEKINIVTQIASALDYLHERGVIFRDLKPNNIGFLNGNQVQLFDFGLSRELPALDTSIPFEMSGKVGTLRYMAPEVAMHQPYNIAADVYSWAMVCYEVMSLQKPFNGWTRDMHANLVCAQRMRPDTCHCLNGSPLPLELCVLLDRSWSHLSNDRPTVPQILSQLALIEKQQLLFQEEQHLQQQLAHQLRAQQIQQHEVAVAAAAAAAAAAIYAVDVPAIFGNNNLQPCYRTSRKISRSDSFDSIETIETTSLSGDSQDYF